MRFRHCGKCGGLALLLAALGACGTKAADPSLDEVKALADKYRDVKVAEAEGYTTDHKCTTAAMLGFPAEMGDMGLHYVRRDLLGLPPKPAPAGSGRVRGNGTHTDFRKPAMLVYEPQADGSLQLVAVENLVFASAWEAAGKKGPPTFRGEPFVLLADKPETKVDEAHGWEPHYELHLWLFRDNPNGTYSEFNPKVTCRYNQPPQSAAIR